MVWAVEGTDEFVTWYDDLSDDEAEEVNTVVDLLADRGPQLGRPYADRIATSRYHHMKELRASEADAELRALFAFDPRRNAILLVGVNKAGDWDGWYSRNIPLADDLYEAHLHALDTEGGDA